MARAKPAPPSTDEAAAEVQAKFDAWHDKGHFGAVVDTTPRHHYTVAGVTACLATPEHEPHAAAPEPNKES